MIHVDQDKNKEHIDIQVYWLLSTGLDPFSMLKPWSMSTRSRTK